MARKRKRRGLTPIPFEAQINLSTLANGSVLTGGLLTLGEDFFCTSVVASWTIRSSNDEGPLEALLAHGDYTDTEIIEALDASPTDPDDKVANERSRRQVRKVGVFKHESAEAHIAGGELVKTRMMMSIGDGHTIDFGVKNNSGAALTTGATLDIVGTAWGRWQR